MAAKKGKARKGKRHIQNAEDLEQFLTLLVFAPKMIADLRAGKKVNEAELAIGGQLDALLGLAELSQFLNGEKRPDELSEKARFQAQGLKELLQTARRKKRLLRTACGSIKGPQREMLALVLHLSGEPADGLIAKGIKDKQAAHDRLVQYGQGKPAQPRRGWLRPRLPRVFGFLGPSRGYERAITKGYPIDAKKLARGATFDYTHFFSANAPEHDVKKIIQCIADDMGLEAMKEGKSMSLRIGSYYRGTYSLSEAMKAAECAILRHNGNCAVAFVVGSSKHVPEYFLALVMKSKRSAPARLRHLERTVNPTVEITLDGMSDRISLKKVLADSTLLGGRILFEGKSPSDNSVVGQVFQHSVTDLKGSNMDNLTMTGSTFSPELTTEQAKSQALAEVQKEYPRGTYHARCGRVPKTGQRYVFVLVTGPAAAKAPSPEPKPAITPHAIPSRRATPSPVHKTRPKPVLIPKNVSASTPVPKAPPAPTAPEGYSLPTAFVVTAVPQEYEILSRTHCGSCGETLTREGMERQSYIVYKDRIHDILRATCGKCGTRTDLYFDYTDSLPKEHQKLVPQMKRLHGEVPDPPPPDIFAWARQRKEEKMKADAQTERLADVLGSLLNFSRLRELAGKSSLDIENHPPIRTRSHGYAFTFYSSRSTDKERLEIAPSNTPTDPKCTYAHLQKDFGAHTIQLLQDFFEAVGLAEAEGRPTDWIWSIAMTGCEDLGTAEFAFDLNDGLVSKVSMVWDEGFAGVPEHKMEDHLKTLLLACAGLRKMVRTAGIPCAGTVELAVKLPGKDDQWATVDLPENP